MRVVARLALVLLLAVSSCRTAPSAASGAAGPVALPAPAHAEAEAGSPRMSPAEIAARATPAIVSIRTDHSLGTGFVVGSSGLVATNLHVVSGSAKITVTLTDKRELPVVQIENGDRERDLVLLRVAAKDLPTLSLGDSSAMRPGDPVVAIGHPLGLEDTVSNGLVSAVRHIEHVEEELTVLQISAPIAPGSSGGPVFNERGEVIAVATAILMGAQNVSFGVPANYLKPLLLVSDPVSLDVFAANTAEPKQAKVKRAIPEHPLGILDGCSDADLRLIAKSLGEAIDVGAPLYNDGNFAACYHIYAGAAADLQRKLPRTCRKPAKALMAGTKRAERLTSASDQAWAMRDAFDGLLHVIVKKRGKTK
jgi:serine protease Do